MTRPIYDRIYDDFYLALSYRRAEAAVNAGARIDVLDLVTVCNCTASGYRPATFAEVQGIAREYELPRKGLDRDELIDAIAARLGVEVAA